MAAGEKHRRVLCDAEQGGQGLFTNHYVQRLLHQRGPVSLAEPEHHGGEFTHRSALYPPQGTRQQGAVVCP